jgi:hypothetical protein
MLELIFKLIDLLMITFAFYLSIWFYFQARYSEAAFMIGLAIFMKVETKDFLK